MAASGPSFTFSGVTMGDMNVASQNTNNLNATGLFQTGVVVTSTVTRASAVATPPADANVDDTKEDTKEDDTKEGELHAPALECAAPSGELVAVSVGDAGGFGQAPEDFRTDSDLLDGDAVAEGFGEAPTDFRPATTLLEDVGGMGGMGVAGDTLHLDSTELPLTDLDYVKLEVTKKALQVTASRILMTDVFSIAAHAVGGECLRFFEEAIAQPMTDATARHVACDKANCGMTPENRKAFTQLLLRTKATKRKRKGTDTTDTPFAKRQRTAE